MKNCIILGLLGLILLTAGCFEKTNSSTGQINPSDDGSPANNSDPDNNTDQGDDNSDPNYVPTAFENAFSQQFPGFNTLPPRVLEKVATKIPAQGTTLWSCGLHQSEAAIEIAHSNHQKKRLGTRDFTVVGEYPMAVDVNIKHPEMQGFMRLINLSGKEIPTDDEGNFRVGALPHDLAAYIDRNFPEKYPVRAEAISQDALSAKELLNIVNGNIGLGMSTPTYCVVSADSPLFHVYSIVGFKGDDLLILDTNGQGLERFSIQKAGDFLALMNGGAKIEEITGLVKILEMLGLRASIAKANGKLAKQEVFDQWKAYSLIRFHKA